MLVAYVNSIVFCHELKRGKFWQRTKPKVYAKYEVFVNT